MNIQQRLHNLEQTINPKAKDTREPLIVVFKDYSEQQDPDQITAILYTYDGKPERRMTKREYDEYEASKTNAEVVLNTVPRPAKTLELDQAYSREPRFRTGDRTIELIDMSATNGSER